MKRFGNRVADRLTNAAGPRAALSVGKDLRNKGTYERAAHAFLEAARMFAEQLGPTHPYVVGAMSQQAWCLAKVGRLPEAADLYRRAIDAKEASGDGDPPTRETLETYLSELQEVMEAPAEG